MNSLRLTLFFILVGIISVSVCSAEDELIFSYDTGNASGSFWGTGKREKYDVAVAIDLSLLKGAAVRGLEIPVAGADRMSDVKVWIASTLNEYGGFEELYSSDVDMQREFDPDSGLITHTLPEQFQIDDNLQKVYIGYSFSLTSLGVGAREPLAVVSGKKEQTYVRTNSLSKNGKWTDLGLSKGLSSCLSVRLGNTIKYAAGFLPLKPVNLKTGDENYIVATLINHGSAGVKTMTYEGKLAETPFSGTISLKEPLNNMYGAERDVDIHLPAIAEIGNYPLELRVKIIDGVINEENGSIVTEINAFNILPVKRPLMEEYTANSCGWCPKGMAAMEIMRQREENDFVAVSFHTWGDPLDLFPDMPAGSGSTLSLPTSQIDRKITIDPYLGDERDSFGLDKCWKRAAEEFAIADIALSGSLEDVTANLKADVTFVYPVGANEYGVEFFVVADGLSVSGCNQKNYFSKNEDCRSMEGLDKFVDSPAVIKDMVYDDVVVAWSGKKGRTEIKGTSAYKTQSVNVSLNIPEIARGVSLRGVAAVIDLSNGEVINSVQYPLTLSDVRPLINDRQVIDTSYWNLQGFHMSDPIGLCIRKVTYSDGSCETSKVIIRK